VNLKGYGGKLIPARGYVELPVAYGTARMTEGRFYVTGDGDCLLGMDLFEALGFKVAPPTEQAQGVNSVSSVRLEAYPAMYREWGTITGFIHKPTVNPQVVPVRQGLRRTPLALRESISAELNRMLKDGAIERVATSPWISSLVVAPKPDKTIGLRVDITEPNKAIIPEQFPLPTMEELSCAIAGSTVLTKLDLK
jgi:hypothetical protein